MINPVGPGEINIMVQSLCGCGEQFANWVLCKNAAHAQEMAGPLLQSMEQGCKVCVDLKQAVLDVASTPEKNVC